MDEIRVKAKQDYMKGMKYRDICDKHDISMNTLKSWVSRNGWAKLKKECTQNKKGAPKKEDGKEKKVNKRKIEYQKEIEKLEDADLTDKQRLFCVYYNKCFNATKAYQKAYKVDYITANAAGSRLLANVSIKEEIQRLKQSKLNRAMLDEDDIFQKYIDIAFADITDYISFGSIELPIIDNKTKEPKLDENGNAITSNISYVDLKNDSEIDGTIVSEISKGKDGVKVKLQDKMKALQWLSDRMDLLPTETQVKIEKTKAQIEKIKGISDDIEDLSELRRLLLNE